MLGVVDSNQVFSVKTLSPYNGKDDEVLMTDDILLWTNSVIANYIVRAVRVVAADLLQFDVRSTGPILNLHKYSDMQVFQDDISLC
jgi:hypothetical protein